MYNIFIQSKNMKFIMPFVFLLTAISDKPYITGWVAIKLYFPKLKSLLLRGVSVGGVCACFACGGRSRRRK